MEKIVELYGIMVIFDVFGLFCPDGTQIATGPHFWQSRELWAASDNNVGYIVSQHFGSFALPSKTVNLLSMMIRSLVLYEKRSSEPKWPFWLKAQKKSFDLTIPNTIKRSTKPMIVLRKIVINLC